MNRNLFVQKIFNFENISCSIVTRCYVICENIASFESYTETNKYNKNTVFKRYAKIYLIIKHLI